ncbi:hypothetical protein BCIN_10g06040 [Botrytis cinerea B05.10]|uniref:Uncharacterized protein n=1 Tax=Botryotinia fuckeliana (strain B05.10) TaxID=332648 RepID=A0A384JVS2_BOTFB|nr:hypothetical protein BCIN_10g06040 [Botrytis cinerea B05.10]ATZ54621.1 hypothetical protein BCIN_10g06040 [Botrytis cinerea B05.10]
MAPTPIAINTEASTNLSNARLDFNALKDLDIQIKFHTQPDSIGQIEVVGKIEQSSQKKTWEQLHALIFDVANASLFITDRSVVERNYTRIPLPRAFPYIKDYIYYRMTRAKSDPLNSQYMAYALIDRLGIREQRLRGEIKEAWVLNDPKGRRFETVSKWKFWATTAKLEMRVRKGQAQFPAYQHWFR